MNTQESYYLIEKMIIQNLIDKNITRNINSKYFAHYKTEIENKKRNYYPFEKYFFDNYEELSKNDFELHKKLIKEGHNPNEIAKIIRNDEIEKLQEISSQTNFNFDQIIEPSLYERCSFINQKNVTLTDYAAFFSSIKCFKYLLMNGAKVENTGKYAVASGNEEIIHLCEQNHSSFEGAYETAIMFHRNDIFKYLYESKLEKTQPYYLVSFCIKKDNYNILKYFEEEGMNVDDDNINESSRNGNLYLVKYFIQNNQIPKNILPFASESGNVELVKYILDKEGIDVNAKNVEIYEETALHIAVRNNNIEIVKLLLDKEGIDVNAKTVGGKRYGGGEYETALHIAVRNNNIEIVKLLLDKEGIDVNVKYYETALHIAVRNNNIEIVKLLLDKGIDVHVKTRYYRYRKYIKYETALHIAVRNINIEIVKLLLDKGININAKTYEGEETALHIAVRNNNIEIVKLLLDKGININAKTVRIGRRGKYGKYGRRGETAKQIAQQKGYTEIVNLFGEKSTNQSI